MSIVPYNPNQQNWLTHLLGPMPVFPPGLSPSGVKERDRPVYKNVRFKDLQPGDVYKVNFKTHTFTRTSQNRRFSSRELKYVGWRPSPFSQLFYFIDLVTGEITGFYQRMTESLLESVNTMEIAVKVLRNVSKPKFMYRLRARGRDL